MQNTERQSKENHGKNHGNTKICSRKTKGKSWNDMRNSPACLEDFASSYLYCLCFVLSRLSPLRGFLPGLSQTMPHGILPFKNVILFALKTVLAPFCFFPNACSVLFPSKSYSIYTRMAPARARPSQPCTLAASFAFCYAVSCPDAPRKLRWGMWSTERLHMHNYCPRWLPCLLTPSLMHRTC